MPRQKNLIDYHHSSGTRIFWRQANHAGTKIEFEANRPFSLFDPLKFDQGFSQFLKLKCILSRLSHGLLSAL